MRRARRVGRWQQGLELLAFVFFALAVLGGCAKKPRSLAGIGAGGLPPGEVGDPCAVPNTGCACETDGDEVECGSTVSQVGDMLTCAMGKRVCLDSKWSECLDTHLEEQTVHGGAQQWHEMALGSQAKCPDGYDDCDPYCKYQNDVPDSTLDAGTNFTVNDAGLTLKPTGTTGCTTLTITPSTTSVVITSFSPAITTVNALGATIVGNKITLLATIVSPTCVTPNPGFDTTWTIDRFDRAAITGTKNNDGALTIGEGLAGPIKVTAYAGGLSASVTINVRVNVVEAPLTETTPSAALTQAARNRKATTTQLDSFGAGCSAATMAATCRNLPSLGLGASTAQYLYPYPGTWFPLGLTAPVVQYTYTNATGNGQATKLSLRYPKTASGLAQVIAGTNYFNYSLIVKEGNNYTQYEPTILAAAQPLDPQVQIPQVAWTAFERTVRAYGDTNGDYDADIYVQRLANGVVENEYRWGGGTKPIHFAGGQLKGSVYYNSYNSKIGGSTGTNVVGAVLKIGPGAAQPTVAVSGSSGKCTICHSVSADGSTLTFASGDGNGSGCSGATTQDSTKRENMCSFTMPAGTAKMTYTSTSTNPFKFLWGAPYPDGSFYLNNVLDNTRILGSNYPSSGATTLAPGLYRTADAALLASTGAPSSPVTPAFASNGKLLAYNAGTLTGDIKNADVVVSESSSCNVAMGVKPSEVSACGQPYGVTLSEVSSCPGVTVSELSACGSAVGGVNVSEVASCGAVPGLKLSEISACAGVTISEIGACGVPAGNLTLSEVSACAGVTLSEVSSCQQFTPGTGIVLSEISACRRFSGSSGESYEIRNDGPASVTLTNYTIFSGTSGSATSCGSFSGTLAPGASKTLDRSSSCLGNTGTAVLRSGTAASSTLIDQRTYLNCGTAPYSRSVRSCTGTWVDGQSGSANDAANSSCHPESFEIRNDSSVVTNIAGWTLRNTAGTTCFTVPGPTTNLAAGATQRFSWIGDATDDCLDDGGDTARLFDAAGTPVERASHDTPACTATAPIRSVFDTSGAWTNAAGYTQNAANDTGVAGNREGIDIRNDSAAAITPAAGTWTVRTGASCAAGTVCATLPASAIAAGASTRLDTGNCLPDAGTTLTLCNGATAVMSHTYGACTASQPTRSVLSCSTAWSYDLPGLVPDATANTCTVSNEFVEIRNDSPVSVDIGGYTVAGSSACFTVPAGTTLLTGASQRFRSAGCMTDASGTVTMVGGGNTVSHAYTACVPAAPSRSVLSCTGTWADGQAGAGNQTTNDSCSNFEGVDIRNDTGATFTPTGYTVRAGNNCAGPVCAALPGAPIAPGASIQVNTDTGACFANTASSVTLCSNTAAVVATHAYTACTSSTPTRSVLNCSNAWADGQAGSAYDAPNNSCTNSFEFAEIRNDTPATIDVSLWTVQNNAGTVCYTIPAGTTLSSGQAYSASTSSGACFTDAGDTVKVYNGAALQASRAFVSSCNATTPKRGALTCLGTWSNDLAGGGNDTANGGCMESAAEEWVEIRNDTAAALAIADWTVRVGGSPCARVPTGTAALGVGASWRGYTLTGACLPDAGSTVTINDAAGVVQATRVYTSSCTATAGTRSVLSCNGTRTDNVATTINNTTNDTCSNKEGVDIRNDTLAAVNISNYKVKNGATVCATVPSNASTTALAPGAAYHVDTGSCLADGTGTVTLTLSDGTTVVNSHAYNFSCASAHPRSSLSCAGAWTESVAPPANAAFDTANDTCGASQQFEAVEVRNDTPATVDVSAWTVRNTGSGATCATMPGTAGSNTTTLPSGSSIRVSVPAGNCLTDGTGSVTVYNGTGVAQSVQAYTAACGSRATLSCTSTWTNSQVGTTDDSSNNNCSASQSYEWVEIRNDTTAPVDIGLWTVRVGGTTCFTVPAGQTLASGGVYAGYPAAACLPDAGGTIGVYDASGDLRSSQAYTSTCSVGTPKRGNLPCPSSTYTWANDVAGPRNAGNDTCSGSYAGDYDSSGKTMRVKDFACGASGSSVTCSAGAKTFSNERTVVDCTASATAWGAGSGHDACSRPSYPAFLPDNTGLLYQHQIADSGFESRVNSAYGALAEIWITKPTAPASPVALDNLNGWNGTNAVSIPTAPRSTSLSATDRKPVGAAAGYVYDSSWHSGATTWVSDMWGGCSTTMNAVAAREDRLNYFPTVSPQEAGGAYWAIFTTRRLYGNVAVSNPWQVQRSNNTANRFGVFTGSCNTNALNAVSPGSGFIETKKLWVSAIDKNWSGTGDPSHPPFYLPGQELEAGNSHGYWVADACTALSGSCQTDDDCCNGTGASPTVQCKTTNTSVVPATKQCLTKSACSAAGAACTTSSNCCGGLSCPVGGGVCLSVTGSSFEAQDFKREFVATCPAGTRVKWQNFEWQATIPSGTSIDFGVQTKELASDPYLPSTAAPLASATTTTTAGTWSPTPKIAVDKALADEDLASLAYLQVTMTFRPNTVAGTAPTLANWRQVYDCLPAE